jgi:hypothetical protein
MLHANETANDWPAKWQKAQPKPARVEQNLPLWTLLDYVVLQAKSTASGKK